MCTVLADGVFIIRDVEREREAGGRGEERGERGEGRERE